jgi:hypothetical protein
VQADSAIPDHPVFGAHVAQGHNRSFPATRRRSWHLTMKKKTAALLCSAP